MLRQSTRLSLDGSTGLNSSTTQNQDYFFNYQSSDQFSSVKRVKSKKHNVKCKTVKKTEMKQKGFNDSRWKIEQNVAYMNFLRQYQEVMGGTKKLRRILKINSTMSQAVKSRTADQCGSHHQKMMKYHRDIPSIIKYIETLMEAKNIGTAPRDFEQLPIFQELQGVEFVDIDDLINLQGSCSSKNSDEFIINSQFNFKRQDQMGNDDVFM